MMKLIIFDFDGCIADTMPIATRVGDELASKYLGENIDFKKIAYNKGLQGLITEIHFPKYRIPLVVRKFRKLIAKCFGEVKAIPGMIHLIKALNSEGYILGIITSNSRKSVKQFLKRYKLEKEFSFMKTNVSLFAKGWRIRRVVRKYKINKRKAVMIGDEVRDIVGAKKAGIKSIAVTWGMNSKKLLKKQRPSYIVSKPKQILRIIEKL
jgi:phosphoglycolate phosphatase